MAVRYNGLNVINGNPAQNPDGFIGDLATLLIWNNTDRSDDFEMNHNNVVYEWQRNRNPFVDYPELANYIWGSNIGQPWSSTLSKKDFGDTLNISVYPNPASDYIIISGLSNDAKLSRLSQDTYSTNNSTKLGKTEDINNPHHLNSSLRKIHSQISPTNYNTNNSFNNNILYNNNNKYNTEINKIKSINDENKNIKNENKEFY